ncbi:MAG: class I SAM-dependent methyltransferase [Acidimicrobiales bacterium]
MISLRFTTGVSRPASSEPFDQPRADAFAGKMVGILNSASIALLCSVGRRTELFDTMATMTAATSNEIAAAAGLQERNVREWLSAMVCGGIVEHDPSAGTFRLPDEHAAALTKAAGASAISHFCQYIGLMGEVETDVVRVFRDGGGVPYERYTRFQELMAESSATRFDAGLIDLVVPLLPNGISRLTQGADVADIGCGRGKATLLLAETFPASNFTGYDFSEAAIAAAQAEAARRHVSNTTFEARDAAKLSLNAELDIVTSFDAVHDQAHPAAMLLGIFTALRPGGTYLCVEPKASSHLHENLDHPAAPFLYGMSTMHCMTVSLAYGGDGLGAAWGEQLAREKLTAAGFVEIAAHTLPHDRLNTYFTATKPP